MLDKMDVFWARLIIKKPSETRGEPGSWCSQGAKSVPILGILSEKQGGILRHEWSKPSLLSPANGHKLPKGGGAKQLQVLLLLSPLPPLPLQLELLL